MERELGGCMGGAGGVIVKRRETHPVITRLRAEREARGLSRQGLSQSTGAYGNAVKRWEDGTSAPRLDLLVNWARELGFDVVLLRRETPSR